MSFAQLQKVILDEAAEQAAQVKKRYRQEVANEERRISARAKRVEETVIKKAEEEGQQQAKRLHQEAQLKAKAQILEAKQAELEAVQKMVVEKLLRQSSQKSRVIIKSLMNIVPKGKGTVTAGEKHINLVKEYAAKKKLAVDERVIAGDGGFVYRGKDMELNVTVSHLVQQLFSRQRTDIAKVLFE